MLQRPCSLVLVMISLASLATMCSTAKECPVAAWQIERIRPLTSPNETVSSTINNHPGGKKLLEKILDHFFRLGNRREERDLNGTLKECSVELDLKAMLAAAQRRTEGNGLGEPLDCLTVIDDEDKDRGYNSSYNKKLFESMVKFNHIVKDQVPAVLRSYGLNWEEKDLDFSVLLEATSEEGYRHCNLVAFWQAGFLAEPGCDQSNASGSTREKFG